MDPKLQEAYAALDAADKAGNTQDATSIADYIVTLQASAQKSPKTMPAIRTPEQRFEIGQQARTGEIPMFTEDSEDGGGSFGERGQVRRGEPSEEDLRASTATSAIGAGTGALLGFGGGALSDRNALTKLSVPEPPVMGVGPRPVLPAPPARPTLINQGTSTPGVAPGQAWKAATGYGAGSGHTVEEVVEAGKAQNKPIGSGKIAKTIVGPSGIEGVSSNIAAKEQEVLDKQRIQQEQAKHRAEIAMQNQSERDRYASERASHSAEVNRINAEYEAKKARYANDVNMRNQLEYERKKKLAELKTRPFFKTGKFGSGVVGALAGMVAAPLIQKGIDYLKPEEKSGGGAVGHFAEGRKVPGKAGAALRIGKGLTEFLVKPSSLAEKFGYDPAKVAKAYPDIIPPVMAVDAKTGKEYLQKQNSPEALAVQKARNAAQKQIDAGEYDPFFDITKRYYADPAYYPTAGKTLTDIVPKKAETIAKYEALANDPVALERLRGAFEKAKDRPNAKDWYAMGQLENEFIKELGAEEGRRQFKNRFADAMAATTGGADPNSNLMMAAYTNYQKNLGKEIPTKGYDLPFPVGGRFVSGNMEQAKKLAEMGEIPVTNPKRHNFSANFLGHRDVSTLDEQMSQLWDPKMMSPPPNAYGIYEAALAKEAQKAGVQPGNFQDIAWAGAKDYPGKAMMQEINEMLARTSKVTGESQEDVLKGYIQGNKPMYGVTGLALGAEALNGDDEIPKFDRGGLAVSGLKKLLGLSDEAIEAWQKANKVSQRQTRVPQVQQAAQALREGLISAKEYRDIVQQYMPIKPFTSVPNMPTPQEMAMALHSNKLEKGLIESNLSLPKGTRVGSRLDIPAYEDYDKWVASIHEGSKPGGNALGYAQTAHLTGDKGPIQFMSSPKAGLNIAVGTNPKTGESVNKSTIARIHGDWEGTPSEDVYKRSQDLLGHPEWAQVGMNPFRHSYFYDKADMTPVVSAEEVLQVGPLVLAKKPKKVDPDDPQFRIDKDDPKSQSFKSGGGAWTRSEGKNPEGGLNAIGRASLKAQGHDIKPPQPEGGSRKDSFCARMGGMKKKLTSSETANDPDSRINKALRKWKC